MCFSSCLEGQKSLKIHSLKPESQRDPADTKVAQTSSRGLYFVVWRQHAGNTTVTVSADQQSAKCRQHCVGQEAGCWHFIVLSVSVQASFLICYLRCPPTDCTQTKRDAHNATTLPFDSLIQCHSEYYKMIMTGRSTGMVLVCLKVVAHDVV